MGDVPTGIKQGREHEMSMKLEEIGEELGKVRGQLGELVEQLKEGGGDTVVTRWQERKQAIEYVNSQIDQSLLNCQNANLANVNTRRPVWWLHIPLNRTCRELHILLKRQDGGLVWLKLPANTLSEERFRCRKIRDKKKIDLEIGTEGVDYLKDIKSGGTRYDFSPHVVHEFPGAGRA